LAAKLHFWGKHRLISPLIYDYVFAFLHGITSDFPITLPACSWSCRRF